MSAIYPPKFKKGDLIKVIDGHKTSYSQELKHLKILEVIEPDHWGVNIKKKLILVKIIEGHSLHKRNDSVSHKDHQIYVYETQFELVQPVTEDYDIF